MNTKIHEAEVDRLVAEFRADEKARGVVLGERYGLVRKRIVAKLEAERQAAVAPRRAPPVKPVAPPVPAHLAAERARMARIIALAPAGAEAERDAAILAGMPVEAFKVELAARAIV